MPSLRGGKIIVASSDPHNGRALQSKCSLASHSPSSIILCPKHLLRSQRSCKMTNTEQLKIFPEWKSTPKSKRSIIGPMYDDSDDENESEYSFVHPYGTKRCDVKSRTILDSLESHIKDIQMFGHAVTLHANHKIQKFLEDDYESDDSNDRISKSKTLNSIVEKAAGCAANLRTVADEIGESNPCGALALVPRGGGDSYSSEERRRKIPIQVVRRKNSSEARAHSGFLTDDISVTSEEFYIDEYIDEDSCERQSEINYNSSCDDSYDEDSYDDSYDGSESETQSSDYASSCESQGSSNTRETKRQYFLHRRALERAAARSERDGDQEESDFDNQDSALTKKKATKHVHSQEMRPTHGGVANGKVKSLAGKSLAVIVDSNAESETNSGMINWSSKDSTISTESILAVSNDRHSVSRQLSWESKEVTILVQRDQVNDILTSSHVGPVITKLTCPVLAEVFQLGDVVIRLNGEDVSTLEGQDVSELLMKMGGKNVRLTFLRKTMQV
ncbi:hypothetical protein HJC23_006987 [Cyclotella cryptica]|uniref:PDZ domain-containing protein n=1 Tax=Cyclotella cryptica TaxID=29204 RepID=A0ABD3QME4_9STRA